MHFLREKCSGFSHFLLRSNYICTHTLSRNPKIRTLFPSLETLANPPILLSQFVWKSTFNWASEKSERRYGLITCDEVFFVASFPETSFEIFVYYYLLSAKSAFSKMEGFFLNAELAFFFFSFVHSMKFGSKWMVLNRLAFGFTRVWKYFASLVFVFWDFFGFRAIVSVFTLEFL